VHKLRFGLENEIFVHKADSLTGRFEGKRKDQSPLNFTNQLASVNKNYQIRQEPFEDSEQAFTM